MVIEEKLLQGLQTLNLSLSEQQRAACLKFIELISKWNKAYNLTAVRESEQMVNLHILDSLAVLPHIKADRIVDIGTGAGLPGIPLAICQPDSQFVLLDSNAKKTRFVTQAVLELQLKNVSVVHSRVELFKPEQLFSTVITRAFAELSGILTLTQHLLHEDGWLLAMKGKYPEQELKSLLTDYKVIPLNVPGVNAERCLIRLENTKHG